MNISKSITTVGLPALVIIFYVNNTLHPSLPSLIILIAPLIVFLHFVRLLFKPKKRIHNKKNSFLIFTVMFLLAYSTVSILWADDLSNALRYTFFLLIGVGLVAFLTPYIKTQKNIVSFTNLIIYLTTLEIILGVFEALTGVHMPNSRHYSEDFYYINKFIPTGTFYNENDYAIVLAIGVPFIVTKVLQRRFFISRLILLSLIILSIWLVILTGSRLSLVALIISFVSFIIYKYQTISVPIIFLVTIAAILIFSLYPSTNEGLLIGLSEKLNTDVLQNEDSVDLIRLYLAKIAISAMNETYFLGLGAGGFENYCSKATSFDLRNICVPHNWIFEVGANLGLVAAFLQILFVVILFRIFIKRFKTIKDNKAKDLYQAFGSALPVVLLAGISLSSILQFTIIWVYFAYFIALLNLEEIKG